MEAAIDDNFQEVRGHIEQFRQILKGNTSLKDTKNDIIPTRYSNANQETPQSRTTTEITLSTSSEATQFDDSEINSKIISFPQSPIESKLTTAAVSNFQTSPDKTDDKSLVTNKNSFSSFDTNLASTSPKYANFNNNKNYHSDEESDDLASDLGSDSDSDPELSSYIAQHSAKVNYILSKVGFPADSNKLDQQDSNSDTSDDSEYSDSIDPPPELINSLANNVKPISVKNPETTQSIQDTLANYNSRNSKRQQQIEKAMKLLLSVSNDEMSSDSESNSNSEDEDEEKVQIKAPPVSLQISQPFVLLQKAEDENEEEDSSYLQKSLFQLDEVSSDSDDVPLFVPPVPDEIEMDTDFNLLLKEKEKEKEKEKRVEFDKGITSHEALDASGSKMTKKKNAKLFDNLSDSMNDTVDDDSTLSFNKIFESVTKNNNA